jgi:hypothetical protein
MLSLGYLLVYPFENVRMRMGSEVEKNRIYTNFQDCLSKMRKYEGASSFFRGLALSLPLTLLNYTAAITVYNYLVEKQK